VTDGQTSCHGIVRAVHTRRAVKTEPQPFFREVGGCQAPGVSGGRIRIQLHNQRCFVVIMGLSYKFLRYDHETDNGRRTTDGAMSATNAYHVITADLQNDCTLPKKHVTIRLQ